MTFSIHDLREYPADSRKLPNCPLIRLINRSGALTFKAPNPIIDDTMASTERARDAHKAYVERVKAEFPSRRYDWFRELLIRPLGDPARTERGNLQILDFEGNAPPNEVLRAALCEDPSDEVLDALKTKPSSTATRVVLLCYPWVQYLKFRHIGVMGHALGVNPRLFMEHFMSFSSVRFDTNRRPTSYTNLDTDLLKFRFLGGRYLSACIVQNACKFSALLWEILTTLWADDS